MRLSGSHPHSDPLDPYWDQVRRRARELKTDGCSGISQTFLAPCLEHDIHYRTRSTMNGDPISRRRADWLMLQATMSRSVVRCATPMGWMRYVGLRVAGWVAWRRNAGERVWPWSIL